MDLSRRDALAALAAAGVAGVAGAMVLDDDEGRNRGDGSLPDETLAALVAVAETVYPEAADGIEPFVETYVAGRIAADPAHREGVVTAVADLDATARDWVGAPLTDLGRSARDQLLRDLSVDVADPDPDGNLAAQVRFYLVNELLYAFYASPTGGRLVGIENPAGYPGGTESYQRGRMDDGDG